MTRRLGSEAYERLVEPLLTGIYGGDGEQLSLQATFPQLRALELEHGSLLRGLRAQEPMRADGPPFVSLASGMGTMPSVLAESLERTRLLVGCSVERIRSGLQVELDTGQSLPADGVVLGLPAFAAAEALSELAADLADQLAGIPYASSAIVTLAYRDTELPPLDGYGYVIPRASGSEALAVTWSSSKWPDRAPAGRALVRVYLGRFGVRDVTGLDDGDLVGLARAELAPLGADAEPARSWIHRWPRGMPQYVLGHVERVERIDTALRAVPGLALAGSAYRGVGIPDCIASGEAAAESVARSLASVA